MNINKAFWVASNFIFLRGDGRALCGPGFAAQQPSGPGRKQACAPALSPARAPSSSVTSGSLVNLSGPPSSICPAGIRMIPSSGGCYKARRARERLTWLRADARWSQLAPSTQMPAKPQSRCHPQLKSGALPGGRYRCCHQKQMEWVPGSKLQDIPVDAAAPFSHFTDEETEVEDLEVTCRE